MSENYHAVKLRCDHKRLRVWLNDTKKLSALVCSWCGVIHQKFGKKESIAIFNLYRAGAVMMKKRAACGVSNAILPEEL